MPPSSRRLSSNMHYRYFLLYQKSLQRDHMMLYKVQACIKKHLGLDQVSVAHYMYPSALCISGFALDVLIRILTANILKPHYKKLLYSNFWEGWLFLCVVQHNVWNNLELSLYFI